MAFEKIIVLDDELVIRKTLETQLRRRHYTVAPAKTIAEAEAYLAKDQFDLMFVDVRLPDGDGTQLLERFADDPNAPMIVIITGFGSIQSAVDCMRKGAFDYIVKPCSIDEIEVVLKKAENFAQSLKLNQFFASEQLKKSEIVGSTPAMVHLKKMIRKVAATEATVLITGENGTGKELVASELYRLSPLAGKPFIKVNCAAISENLIESEFFGHERGAFTGAMQRREGRFELANGGTILLDEIGEISPAVQAKLLRVLQEREFERVGGNKTIRVNVRVLATTNRNLAAAVEKGDFREDLYYRLNVFPIETPPLRARKEDIPALAQKFLEQYARKHGVRIPGFSPEAQQRLLRHDWPGNVRELQNTIERAVILCDDDEPVPEAVLGLMPTMRDTTQAGDTHPHFAPRATTPPIPASPDDASGPASETQPASPLDAPISITFPESTDELPSLQDLEREHILRALRVTDGKRNEAAAILDISTRTLRNKINQYRLEGIEVP